MTVRPHIVLVSFERLPAKLFPAVTGTHPQDGFVRGLVRDAVWFSHAFTNSPGTLESLASLWSGLSPAAHGVTGESPATKLDRATLPALLRELGYETVGISTAPELERRDDLVRGFGGLLKFGWRDRLREHARALGRRVVGGHSTPRFSRPLWVNFRFFRWLDRRTKEQPFFAWLHYPAEQRKEGATGALVEAGLEHDVALARVRDLVLALQMRGLWDSTVFVVTALRGASGEERGVEDALGEEAVRIPLLFRLPEPAPRGFVVEEFCQLSDIAPTLVHWVGGEWPASRSACGRVLLVQNRATPGPEAIVVEEYRGGSRPSTTPYRRRLLRTGEFRFVWRSDETVELYDLGPSSCEQKNLEFERPHIVGLLRAQLFSWLASQNSPAAVAEAPPIEAASAGTRQGPP